MLQLAQVAVCSQINTKHINTVWGRTYKCWMLNCWCITWPVGFKRLNQTQNCEHCKVRFNNTIIQLARYVLMGWRNNSVRFLSSKSRRADWLSLCCSVDNWKHHVSEKNAVVCVFSLRRESAAARLLGLRNRILPGVWLSLVSVVCCQVEVSAPGWSIIQRSLTEWFVCVCVCVCVIGKPR